MAESFQRLLRLMFLLPRAPQSMDTETLSRILDGEGQGASLRTTQRDLQKLERMGVGIECIDTSKPFRWRYAATTEARLLPALDPQQALALRLVEKHLEHALPRDTLKALRPQLQAAKKVLEGKPVGRWLDKVRVVSRNQPLLHPATDGLVVGTLHEALLESRQVEVAYRSKQASTTKMALHPLGLIHRDAVAYLVATAFGYSDPRLYRVHRLSDVALLPQKARAPDGFDLDGFIDKGELGWKLGGPVKLELLATTGAAAFLQESRLASEQEVFDDPHSGKLRVTATVPDTRVLRSFLLGFGSGIEVVRPAAIRKALAKEVAAMALTYRSPAGTPRSRRRGGGKARRTSRP